VVTYQDDLAGVTEADLGGFFEGWPSPPSVATHLRLLRSSSHVAIARDDDRVVGFATAISDGVLSAYIPLLEVLPSHRRQGVGCALVERLLARLTDIYMVDVVCDDGVVAFYERLGFVRGVSMMRRNYASL
jgi:ribosomal protein S18 acetylase RimI-like enzyme